MKNKLYINRFVHMAIDHVNNNGEMLDFEQTSDINLYCKNLYKSLQINYPKFYKMDRLSKLGFLASELLLKDGVMDPNTSVVFANKTASLDTDINYQNSINDKDHFFPSPSVFVYTLPNIVIGEVCIRHKFTGENLFIISDEFDETTFLESISLQYELKKANSFIFAWVEVLRNKFEVFSCLISDKKTSKSLTLNNQLFKSLYTKNTSKWKQQ